jgi:hypothetical protein
MKVLIAVALAATSVPVLTTTAAARGDESASNERRVCTQITVRAGSRMSGRRVCRTPTQWREALGPDWRQHLAGFTGLQDDYEALRVRAAPEDLNPGIQGQTGGGLVSRAAGPH